MSTVTTSDWFRERELVSERRESEFPNTKKRFWKVPTIAAPRVLGNQKYLWNIKQNRFEI